MRLADRPATSCNRRNWPLHAKCELRLRVPARACCRVRAQERPKNNFRSILEDPSPSLSPREEEREEMPKLFLSRSLAHPHPSDW